MPGQQTVRRLESAVARRIERRVIGGIERHVVEPLQRGLVRRRPRAHMLHIGKTGGTAMKHVFESLDPGLGRYEIVTHRHKARLADIPRGDKVFFVVRDPVEQYVSGFNSRLREGRPRHENPWLAAERVQFALFTSADQLGRGLSSTDVEERARAFTAMISIQHVRNSYWDWFRSREYLESRIDDLLLIQWLPDLHATFPRLREQLGLPEEVVLPRDDLRTHRTPAHIDRSLSDLARENLERWYGRDYAFIDFCASLDCFAGPSRRSVEVVAPALAAAVGSPSAVG